MKYGWMNAVQAGRDRRGIRTGKGGKSSRAEDGDKVGFLTRACARMCAFVSQVSALLTRSSLRDAATVSCVTDENGSRNDSFACCLSH